ncbi:MAG: hypothetical protein ACR2N5_00420, partial [Solirubrobacterales bacterium]
MRIPTSVLALALLGLLAACGDAPPSEAAGTAATPVRWLASKPSSAVGRVRAAVVERPAPDRAWIEAEWVANPDAHDHEWNHDCRLQIALPDGAFLLEGDTDVALDDLLASGQQRWLVG